MKRICLMLLFCWYALVANAQFFGDLDRVCDTIEYNGECYIKQNYLDLFTVIGNSDDEFMDARLLLRDGTIPPHKYITRNNRPIEFTETQAQRLLNIIDESFNKQQVDTLNDQEVIVHINVRSDTGLPTGVTFTYYNDSGYENIPMEVWQSIEKQIKGEFYFTITDIGKSLNHCDIIWSQCPRGREESEVVLPEDGGEQLEMPSGGLNNPTSGNLGTPAGNSLGTPPGLP